MKAAEPQQEHRWLHKLIGDWTYESDDPTDPAKRCTGSEHVRKLGELWVLAEGQGEAPGVGAAVNLMTVGYDSEKKRFVGSWVGSMMSNIWIYDGELDSSGRILTLNSEGPSMAGDGTTSRYQDVIEFKSDDHRVMSGRVMTDDGTWQQFMTVDYRRKR